MWLQLLATSSCLTGVIASLNLVAVGVYNTSTACPDSCNCPDDYSGVSLYLYQLGSSGQLLLNNTLKAGLNVSWAVSHPSLPVIYTLSEVSCYQSQSSGSIAAWSLADTEPRLLSRLPSGGAAPVHLTLTAQARGLIVSNYLGNLSVFALGTDGAITGLVDQHLTGFGTHSTSLDPSLRYAFTPILGEDRVSQWLNTGASLIPNPSASVQLGAGFGPRHLAFHPSLPRAYIANEGQGNFTRLTVCDYDIQTGTLSVLSTISVTKLSNFSALFPSEVIVSPNGQFVYVSVRDALGQQDSIAVLSVDRAGDLSLIANTGSAWYPRSATLVSPELDDSQLFLLVGAQKARALQVFTADSNTGVLFKAQPDTTFPDAVAFVGKL